MAPLLQDSNAWQHAMLRDIFQQTGPLIGKAAIARAIPPVTSALTDTSLILMSTGSPPLKSPPKLPLKLSRSSSLLQPTSSNQTMATVTITKRLTSVILSPAAVIAWQNALAKDILPLHGARGTTATVNIQISVKNAHSFYSKTCTNFGW